MPTKPRAKRLGEMDREIVTLQVDGVAVEALAGDTVLTAILLGTGQTGVDAFNATKQAGFCLMGACQGCWVWAAEGHRLRACETEVHEGARFFTVSDGAG